ncbi:MAG: sulfatase-like hydrolase/transferase [Chitinophagaceae bacterium]
MKKTASLTTIYVCLMMAYLTEAQTPNQSHLQKKPNIIFILTDDLGVGDIGVFFQNQRKKNNNKSEPWELTPNIDQMAAKGAMLTQNYCNAPVCAPSRSSFMLGVNQGHANVRDNQFDKALEDNYTVANVLKSVGYKTAAIGKWGLQGVTDGPDWPAHPLNRGFDYYFGYMRHADGHEHYPKEGIYRGKKEVWDNRTNIAESLDKCYTGDLWTAAAKKWIVDFEKDNKKEAPFFLYLAYDLPHAVLELPTQAYPKGKGLTGGLQWIGKPGNMINTASGTVDSWGHPDYANAIYDHDKNPATAEVPWPDTYKRYATINRRLDDAVGDLIQLLKDLKIDENTMLIFTSDNGPSIESYLPKQFVPVVPTFFQSFGPFDGIKRDCWEGGVRMPTLVKWPGHIKEGSVVSTPGIFSDWLPTFLDAAGYPAPVRSDGVSLLPSLTGKGRQLKSLVYVEYVNNEATPSFTEFEPQRRGRKRGQMQLIRFDQFVGVRYAIKTAADDFEIYDVIKDPKESKNLAAQPGMALMQLRMKQRVLQVRMPDTAAPRPYDNEYVPVNIEPENTKGVSWKEYQSNVPWLPSPAALQPVANGNGQLPGINGGPFKAGSVVCFEGNLVIPADGDYTFYITSDQAAFLRIHDAAVIDADYGYDKQSEKAGSIKLKAGRHSFKLYVKVSSATDSKFKFEWKGPGIEKQSVPSSLFGG